MALIECKQLSKKYMQSKSNTIEVLKDIDFSIDEGEIVAIVGTSGSGKSTLLRILGCVEPQTSGSYTLDTAKIENENDKRLAKIRNESIGFIMQDFALVDYYDVKRNILLPLVYEGDKKKRSQHKKTASKLLEKLHIGDKEHQLVSELSGGQKQRVAIARALINEPKIILADEPTGALDQKTSQEIMDLLLALHEEGQTIILVTHDPLIANQCQRIVRLEDGKIIEA